MRYEDIYLTAHKQFMLDTGWSEAEEGLYRVTLNKRPAEFDTGRRRYRQADDFFRLIIFGNDAYIMSDGKMYEWVEEYFGSMAPEHMLNYHNLRQLDEELGKHGYMIDEVQECFLPSWALAEQDDMDEADNVEMLFGKEIRELYKEGEFPHALVDPGRDIIAVGVREDGRMAAVAGAARDGSFLWQIGVDVLPDYRMRGLASAMTEQLALILLDKGCVPFYGVRQGNIVSKRTAEAAGFEPAFSEVFITEKQSHVNSA